MLSRRRRVTSSSLLGYSENIGLERRLGDNGVDREKSRVHGILVGATLQASTETSTTHRRPRPLHTPRHVERSDDTVQRGHAYASSRATHDTRSNESDVASRDRDSTAIGKTMSLLVKNCRASTQRPDNGTRRRRRLSVEMLDSNVDVFQINSSRASQRIAMTLSESGDLAPLTKTGTSVSGHMRVGEDFVLGLGKNEEIAKRDDSDASICPNIPDNDKISRKEICETFEARTRYNYHPKDDTVMEHKDEPRLKLSKVVPRERKQRTVWPRWANQRSRWLVALGLVIWTTLMITEVAGRQSHHRTCPGCPHQHVHTINRKPANYEDPTGDGASETETAPSPDDLRLEAIKHQILTKLGLRTRPDVNRTLASVPRHLALETLYRAEAQPPGHSIEPDDYHEGRRRSNHHEVSGNDDSLSSLSPSSSSSSLSSSSSSSSSSSLSSSISSSSSSSLSSSPSASSKSSSSSSYGEFYYDGEEYSYRNVDQDALGVDASSRRYGNVRESDETGSYVNNGRHRGHGDYRNGGKARDYHVTDDDDDDDNDDDAGQIEMDDFYARTSEIISFAEPGRTLNGQPLLEFPQSTGDPALEPLRIKRATLWARVEYRHAHHYQHHRRAQTNQRNITLWVFRVRCGNVTHLRGKELGEHLEMVTSLGVNVNQLGWQKFDVTRVVSNWYSGHELTTTKNEKLTLLVDCTGCGSHVHVSTFGAQGPHVVESSIDPKGGEDPDRPFLVVRTDPAAVKRVRRRAIECSGAIKGQCCKQRFYVSFSQLGWDDWIIAPQGYYANYCRGDCAAGHRTPDTFLNYYTHVIEEYRKMDRLAGMQPCCAPLKFSPMSLIYYGPDSNIIKRDLPKMVVDECGCP